MQEGIGQFKNRQYKSIGIKAFILISVLYIADLSIGKLLRYYYFKQESGLQYRTTYSIDKTNADIVIFGASRANHHYQPLVFENRLPQYSYYNAGRDGNSIFYHYAVLKCILNRHIPKIVVLDFDGAAFIKQSDTYDRLSALLPYYNSHPEIHSIIELKSPYENYKLWSGIYPFNSSIFTIAIGNTEFNKRRSYDIKGYVPLENIWNEPLTEIVDSVIVPLDSNKINCYRNFINDCTKNGVKVFVFVSPYFVKSSNISSSVKIGREIAKELDAKFYDYSNDSFFITDHSLFADIVHLNDKGAKIYTGIVVDKIKEDK